MTATTGIADYYGGGIITSKIGESPACLKVKVLNKGSKAFSIDRIVILDRKGTQQFGTYEESNSRFESGDIKMFEVKLSAKDGTNYKSPPDVEAIIEVSMATRTFRSTPFKFANILPERST